MKLAEIQRRLLQGLPPGAPSERQAAACALLDPDGSLEPAQRLSIYRRNISGALLAALESVYPVCRQVLGEGNFAALAREFAWLHPSRGPDLNRYGEALPEFLDMALHSRPALAALVYLPDLARLEWLWHRVHFSADDGAFDFAGFARASGQHPERIRFQLSHSLGLLSSPYPVLEIWRRHRDGSDTRSVAALSDPEHLCIWRRELEPRVTAIDADCLRLLQQCRAGLGLAELANAERLPELIAQGWIRGFAV